MIAAYLPRRVQTKLLHRPMPFNSHHHVHDEHHSKNRILDAMIHERLDPFRYRMIEKKNERKTFAIEYGNTLAHSSHCESAHNARNHILCRKTLSLPLSEPLVDE